jgi:GNAT superfamily N-acetyltransferase
MTFETRKMRQADLDWLVALRQATFFGDGNISQKQDRDGLATVMDGDGFETALIVEVDGKPVGSCLFVRHEIEPMHDVSPWLAGLVVDEEFRGRGIGRALVKAVERHAASVGCRELYLYTVSAESLYAELGWTMVERHRVDDEPLLLMVRRI